MVLTDTGLAKVFQRIKSFIASQLNSKASAIHTHTKSEITDFPTNYVTTNTEQTIGGVKTFSDIPIVVNGKTYVSQINANRADGTQAGFSAYNGFKIVCNNNSQGWDNTAFAIHIPEYSPTSATVAFKLYDCIEGSSSYKGFGLKKIGNNCQLFPTASNAIDLGTSTNKWKSFNGLNPGALSLPSVSSGINLDLTNFKTDGSDNKFRLTSFSNYPYDNGWLFIRLNGCTSYYLDHWYKVVSDSCATPSEAIFFLPINDKDHDIMLRCVCTSINYIRIFPCQGNI